MKRLYGVAEIRMRIRARTDASLNEICKDILIGIH